MKSYVWIRPGRDNWGIAVEECRKELTLFLLSTPNLFLAQNYFFQKYQRISNTFWAQFWDEVVDTN